MPITNPVTQAAIREKIKEVLREYSDVDRNLPPLPIPGHTDGHELRIYLKRGIDEVTQEIYARGVDGYCAGLND